MVDMIQQVRRTQGEYSGWRLIRAPPPPPPCSHRWQDLAMGWKPTKDSKRKKLKRTKKAFGKACGSFKGWASLTEDGTTKYVDFNKFMAQ
jgi:hypothetical protein